MSINAQMVDDGAAIYYVKGFRNTLEDHMTLLRGHPTTSLVMVTPSDAYHYNHNLFGLLQKMKVPLYLHWLIMRMNNWTSPRAFDLNVTSLIWPDQTVVNRIQQSYTASNRIN